jgi:hypothetical protein
MLKLLKHDIKNSWLEITITGIIALIASAVMAIAMVSGTSFLNTLGVTLWVGAIFALVIMLFKNIIKNFHTSMFTGQGYLTLTTPVSIDKIILSKILVNLLWVFVAIVVIIISVVIVVASALGVVGGSMSIFGGIFEAASLDPGVTVMVVFDMFAGILYFILSVFLVSAIVNTGTIKKHKGLFGFLIWFGLYILNAIITGIFTEIVGFSEWWQYFSLGLLLIQCPIFYFLARYLIVNKLELE